MSSGSKPFTALARVFGNYVAVGAVGTMAQYMVLVCAVELAKVPAVPAAVVGATIGAAINYTLNRLVTFGSSLSHRRTLPRFAITALLGIALNGVLMWLLGTWLSLHYLAAQLGATVIVLAMTFSLNLIWTFNHRVR